MEEMEEGNGGVAFCIDLHGGAILLLFLQRAPYRGPSTTSLVLVLLLQAEGVELLSHGGFTLL
jgi:hypothetical protein